MDIPDPWFGPEPGYHQVYKLINEVCDAIVAKYSAQQNKILNSDLDLK
jgi:protein-tyrosine phosphatase